MQNSNSKDGTYVPTSIIADVPTSSQNIAKPNVIGSVPCAYWVTPHLRYAKKAIRPDEQTVKYELRLQQMWQGQDGSQKWEWVEVFE